MKRLALGLMIASILVLLANLYLTVSTKSTNSFYLLPIGIALLISGLVIWLRENRKQG